MILKSNCCLIFIHYFYFVHLLQTGIAEHSSTGMLNDRCLDESSCMVSGGHCDFKSQKCACKNGYVRKNHFKCIKVAKLGEICLFEKQCKMYDRYSECVAAHDRHFQTIYQCTCKKTFRVANINGTEYCTNMPNLDSVDLDNLTPAPVILCFITGLLLELFCLLGFRYWKKHRMQTDFRRHEIDLEQQSQIVIGQLELASSQRLSNLSPAFPTSLPLPNNNNNNTFNVRHYPEIFFPILSGISASSAPPPYTAQDALENTLPISTREEESPPSYEEAIKLMVLPSSLVERGQESQSDK